MLFIGIFTVSLFVTLFAEKKEESSDKEQNAEHISQQDKIAQEKAFTQLKEVEDKYQKQFIKLGFDRVYPSIDTKGNRIYVFKLNDFQIAEIQLLASSYQVDKLIDENLKINFEYINLELQKDKLVIKGLQYDKKLVSQAQLANQLNTVMEKIIMPKLREIKQEADTQKSNIASHKE
jgi:hypothetical protein